uniref:NnrS family protein n=1 Tax=candidate division WOR-3 bacterium TaxID=2052148 RepID=A0A7V3KP31_UNCW3
MDNSVERQPSRERNINNIYLLRRKVLLYYVIVATLLATIGTIMGLIELFVFSGYISQFQFGFFDHPFLQIYGFLIIFVSGVAVVLVPTFRGHTPDTGYLDYLFLIVMVLFQVFVVAAMLISNSEHIFMYAAFACVLVYSIRYNFLVWEGTNVGARKIDLGDFFLVLSGAALLLSSITFLHNFLVSPHIFTLPMIYILLIGFAGSVIIGVMIKTSPSSPSKLRRSLIRISMLFALVSVLVDFFIAVFGLASFDFMVGILFLIEIGCFALAQLVLAIKSVGSGEKIKLRSAFSMKIISFSRMSAAISYFWITAGIIFGISYSLDHSLYYLKIASIHSIGLGFIGSTIMGYAPLLLPGIISERTPRLRINPTSFYFFNIGTVLMVSAFAMAAYAIQLSALFISSGILIVIGIIWYIVDIHLYIFHKTEEESVSFSDNW